MMMILLHIKHYTYIRVVTIILLCSIINDINYNIKQGSVLQVCKNTTIHLVVDTAVCQTLDSIIPSLVRGSFPSSFDVSGFMAGKKRTSYIQYNGTHMLLESTTILVGGATSSVCGPLIGGSTWATNTSLSIWATNRRVHMGY